MAAAEQQQSPTALGVLLVFHISNIDTQIISPVFTL
jgi:hypothetical protein